MVFPNETVIDKKLLFLVDHATGISPSKTGYSKKHYAQNMYLL